MQEKRYWETKEVLKETLNKFRTISIELKDIKWNKFHSLSPSFFFFVFFLFLSLKETKIEMKRLKCNAL